MDFLKMNLGLTRRVKTVLNFANFTFKELCDITKSKILQHSIRVPLGIEKEFISCFRKIPNPVISQINAELCNELFETILTEQERRMSFNCTTGEPENLRARMLRMESKNSSKEKLYQMK